MPLYKIYEPNVQIYSGSLTVESNSNLEYFEGLEIPGPPEQTPGELMQFRGYIIMYEEGNSTLESPSFNYEDEMRCSYDPNDKLVYPKFPMNYALIDEYLTYTIRFQNTGNNYAYHVELLD